MNKSNKKLHALVVDDDPDSVQILGAALKKLEITFDFATDTDTFLQKLKSTKPDFCLIDLNIGRLGVGFTLIQAIRSSYEPRIPLFVVSGASDAPSIAHAQEVGASDFIVKPIDQDLLATKLARHFSTPALAEAQLSYFYVPGGGEDASFELELEIESVDEFGIRLESSHLLSKGLVVHLSGEKLEEITSQPGAQLLKVVSTWVNPENQSYGALAEFDTTNRDLMAAVRQWLMTQK